MRLSKNQNKSSTQCEFIHTVSLRGGAMTVLNISQRRCKSTTVGDLCGDLINSVFFADGLKGTLRKNTFLGDTSTNPLWWPHNDHDSVSNHQPDECLLNRLFRRTSKKTSNLRVTGLRVGNSPGPVNSPHKGPVTRKMFPLQKPLRKPITC